MVGVDGGGTNEAVTGVVSQHDVGQSADLGMAVTLERGIEQLAIGIPCRRDELVTAGGIGQRIGLEMYVDVFGA